MDKAAIETYDRAYNRAARVRRELADLLGIVSWKIRKGELATAEELEQAARLRRELNLLGAILDVDVLR